MWNEPNGGFWPPQANVQQYTTLALAASKAIRRSSPHEWLIGPGMSGMDLTFLRACCARGLLRYWNAVSFHPYRLSPPETAATDFAEVRALIAQYAPKGRHIPILSSEWGYSVAYPGLNIERQARFAVREFLSNMAAGLRLSIWYDWHDDGTDPKNAEHNFGTVTNDYQLKPDYTAISTLAKYLSGFEFNKRIALASKNDYCLLFSHGTQQRLALWTSDSTPHDVTIPMSADPLRLIQMNGDSRQASADDRGFTVTISHSPEYVIPEGPNDLLAAVAAWHSLPSNTLYTVNSNLNRDLSATFTAIPFLAGSLPHNAQVTTSIVQGRTEHTLFSISHALVGHAPTLNGGHYLQAAGTPKPTLRSVLRIAGAEFVQLSTLTPLMPITVSVLPPTGLLQTIKIENPLDFNGKVLVKFFSNSGTQMRLLDLATLGKTAEVSMRAPTNGPVDVVVRLVNGSFTPGSHLIGNCITRTGPIVFQPIHLFSSSTHLGPLAQSGWTAVPDGNPSIASSIIASVVVAPAGGPAGLRLAGQIRYQFSKGWKFLRVSPLNKVQFVGKPSQLGLWVFGDGTGNGLNMRFTDKTGQTFQAGAGEMTWTGWRFIHFSLNSNNGHWGGANDGHLHYPLRLDTLLIVDGLNRATNGEVWVADPWLIYTDNDE